MIASDENRTIIFDPADWNGMLSLMLNHSSYKFPLFGKNCYGEDVKISICRDSITTETYQNNGYTRINLYWNDFTVEELYEAQFKEL